MATGPSSAPRRVLIIKPSALGDVASAMPVLRGLRRTHPRAHLAGVKQLFGPLPSLGLDNGWIGGIGLVESFDSRRNS